jgi:two-component system, chemotaxis family, chemotaxis protein CheY
VARVLVVDDLELVRALCVRLLAKAGHQVIEASNGADALKLYQHQPFDAVLLDVSMPELDGLATLQALRKLDPHARVAMLTSYKETDVVRQAIVLGARDYVAKPFQHERLLAAVEKLVGP